MTVFTNPSLCLCSGSQERPVRPKHSFRAHYRRCSMAEADTDTAPPPAHLRIRRSSSLSDLPAFNFKMGVSRTNLSSESGSMTSLPGVTMEPRVQHASVSLSGLVRHLFGSTDIHLSPPGVAIITDADGMQQVHKTEKKPSNSAKLETGYNKLSISPLIGYFTKNPDALKIGANSSVVDGMAGDGSERPNSSRSFFRFVANRDLNSWAPSST